ncbi:MULTISPECIES: DNA/RNA nuclease SfsA [Stutzerimonas stutzeri subgroup]|jgi:sugar fermentation stimulation protein A|uniref:DNA/RNA nuclease SfsA n=1 Tax=Stutzerimonas chloritidismutans TaxID=203192 RepID=A0ACC5VER4_STUCH|nr:MULTISPECIES: DNA/RNA nuclease SfsA [Stutzerimonas stutzeri subgroup]KJS24353.1 MAG: XRE family transcriptional regulator [Pseudomonas sp. BRH_c35]KKJ95629.1 XRE family transcriptional regulator [Stutzerimonas stutzeri]MAF88674.1 DNA/RNA nuclease SfsA [Pseudomonas sp.]OHC14215.1 MAG: sugar fermentation stimulation protein SfsA [Pseudomonadales bacterium GWC2_63_15]MAK86292.1 DNA/RNA nuclease SfsA [Pseudomonas sp.]|tara:strand:+ start:22214 stop:22921 length:708 start_codon:yes stop_codon:yes gene_type:complete
MRFAQPLEQGRLVRRYKRFLADIITDEGEALCIHCPNTGSMLNCMGEGARVWFQRSSDPRRKLPGTWELVETPQGRLACVNTARANPLVEEALLNGQIAELAGFTTLKREVAYGVENSRVDFRLDYAGTAAFVEVKSVTLGFAETPVAAFPDAVTTRGARHLRELATLARAGVRAVQLYCVNLSGIEAVRPAEEIDPAYAAALREAQAAGVEVLAYGVDLSVEELRIAGRLPVLL